MDFIIESSARDNFPAGDRVSLTCFAPRSAAIKPDLDQYIYIIRTISTISIILKVSCAFLPTARKSQSHNIKRQQPIVASTLQDWKAR